MVTFQHLLSFLFIVNRKIARTKIKVIWTSASGCCCQKGKRQNEDCYEEGEKKYQNYMQGERELKIGRRSFLFAILLLAYLYFGYPACFYFRWNSVDSQHLLLNAKTVAVSSWNVGHVLKTAWKWSSWSLIWEQDGTYVSFITDIHVCILSSVISLPQLKSSVISLIVSPMLPSPSSAVLFIIILSG